MSMLVDIFKALGFDEAPPGEFTKRAFLNNKISLAEAEAVVDLIDSHDQDGVVLSSNTLSGDFTEKVLGFSETRALSKPSNLLNTEDLPEFTGPTNITLFFAE